MRAREAPEHFGQHDFAEILLQAESDPAFQIDAAHRDGGFVVQFDEPSCVSQHQFAGFGQRETAA